MERLNFLPEELIEWLDTLQKSDLRRRIKNSISQRAEAAGLALIPSNLAATVDALDERYFSLHEEGQERESLKLFKQARLVSAQMLLIEGKDEEALYEFFHSLDDATAEGAMSELEKAKQQD